VFTTFSKHRFTLDAVSQLDRDVSTALVTIREWRNSLTPINRLPSEVLSLIPTHLPSEDLFRASSVCRRWRRTFIQHAVLWSKLDLTTARSDFFVKTLLERAKGSALDIRFARLDHAGVLALLSPHAQKFRIIKFVDGCLSDIQRFSEVASGPLPLLHTLKIRETGFGASETIKPPSPLPFSGAVNLRNFSFRSEGVPLLNHFAFPNLTTFKLSTMIFHASQLLDFLEASPTLRTVRVRVTVEIDAEDVPSERAIVLPNVEIFSITHNEPDYRIAAHISCPSARRMSLAYEQRIEAEAPQGIFHTWNAIGPQHTANTVDEVALEITNTEEDILSCFLSLFSPGSTTLELGCTMFTYENHSTILRLLENKHPKVISHAFKAIRTHPLLKTVKRLRIRDRHRFLTPHRPAGIAEETTRLFRLMGPLEELILDVDDLRPFLSPFFDPPKFQVLSQPHAFPSIKVLTIAERLKEPLDEECVAAIVEFVWSQSMCGVPFERAVFHTKFPPAGMAERLKPWVGTVHFSEEVISGGD